MYGTYEEAVESAKSVDGCGRVAVIKKTKYASGISYNYHFEPHAMPLGHIFQYKYDPPAIVVGNVFNGVEVNL